MPGSERALSYGMAVARPRGPPEGLRPRRDGASGIRVPEMKCEKRPSQVRRVAGRVIGRSAIAAGDDEAVEQPVGGSLSSCAAPSSEPSSFSRWSSPSRRCLSLPFQPHQRDGFIAPSAVAVVAISPTTFVPSEPSPTLSKTRAVCVLI
eukprot:gene33589-56233_t